MVGVGILDNHIQNGSMHTLAIDQVCVVRQMKWNEPQTMLGLTRPGGQKLSPEHVVVTFKEQALSGAIIAPIGHKAVPERRTDSRGLKS